MKKLLSVLFLTLFGKIIIAQTITVLEQKSGSPIDQAALISDKPKAFTTTNIKGQANIEEFVGAETIEIRSLGFKPEYFSYKELEKLNFQVQLSEASINMDEIVVSATRWTQNSADVPSKMATISSRDIHIQAPQTAADLLGASGQVFIQKSQQGGGSPMIRGFATNRLLYSVDGIRMNTAIFRGGNIQNVISLDPFAIEHTEVLFGPGSVIYGSDAIGGVMSFQTLKPQLSLDTTILVSGKAAVRYATANNEKTGHFDVNIGWKRWALLTSISANDYDDLKMGSYGPKKYLRPFYVERINGVDVIKENPNPKVQKPSGYSQMNLMQKARFKPNKNWDFVYAFHYSETSDYARYDRHIRYKNGLPRYGEWSYGPQIWMMNTAQIINKSKNKLYNQLTARIAQQYFEESRITRKLYDNNRETNTEKVNAYSINVDFVKELSSKNRLFYGVESVLNDVKSLGISQNIISKQTNVSSSRYPNAQWESHGFYVNNQHSFSKKLLAQTGVRYNVYKLKATFDNSFYNLPFSEIYLNNGALTGSIGVVFKPTEKWNFSTNIGSAFRAPNVDDVGKIFDSEPGAVVVPNPDLKAEYAYNIDLDIAKMIGDVLKVDIVGYYTLLDNAMVRRDFALNGADSIVYSGEMSKVQAIQNAAQSNVYGFQAGLEFKLPIGFVFSNNFNYQIGKEELNDGTISPSRHAAPWFGTSRVSYKTDKLYIQFYLNYSDEKTFDELPVTEKTKDYIYAVDKNGNPWSPGWYTLNFKALYQLTENLSINVGLENITDQRYKTYSSGIAAAGRNFIFGLRATF